MIQIDSWTLGPGCRTVFGELKTSCPHPETFVWKSRTVLRGCEMTVWRSECTCPDDGTVGWRSQMDVSRCGTMLRASQRTAQKLEMGVRDVWSIVHEPWMNVWKGVWTSRRTER